MWGRTLGIGTRETMHSPVLNNYTAGDGRSFWIVGLEGDRHWPALARAVGHPEWITDSGSTAPETGPCNARELIGLLDEIFATRPLDEWAEAFAAEPELFWSPVNTIDDVVADEQFLAAHSVVDVPDEQGTLPMLATPVDFDGRPPAPRWRAPLLGEHTREVLREMGHDEDATASLVSDGIAVVTATRRRRADTAESDLLGHWTAPSIFACITSSASRPSSANTSSVSAPNSGARPSGFGCAIELRRDEINGNVTESPYSIGWTNPLAIACGIRRQLQHVLHHVPLPGLRAECRACLVEGHGRERTLQLGNGFVVVGPQGLRRAEPRIDRQVLAADGDKHVVPVAVSLQHAERKPSAVRGLIIVHQRVEDLWVDTPGHSVRRRPPAAAPS